MKLNSQKLLTDLLATDDDARAEWNEHYKLKNDPRITWFGNFIRRSSIDELPQLINVLKGDARGLVGPRPVMVEERPTLTWGSPTLPSAMHRFTSEFGMGSGGSNALWSSSKLVGRWSQACFSTEQNVKVQDLIKACYSIKESIPVF